MTDLGAQHSDQAGGPLPDDGIPNYSSRSDTATGSAPDDPKSAGPDALDEALRRVGEARDYLAYLGAVEVDRFRLRIRRAATWVIVGLTAVALVLAVLAAASGLVLWGLAELVSKALNAPLWLGALTVGGGVLLLGALAIGLALWSWNLSAFNAMRRRYVERRRRQRAQFGRSIDQSDQ